MIQLSFQINNFTIIVPGLAVVAGLNIWAAILSQVIRVGLVFIGYVGVAHFAPNTAFLARSVRDSPSAFWDRASPLA